MRRTWMKFSLVTAALVTATLAGCEMNRDSSDLVTNPQFEMAGSSRGVERVRGSVPAHVRAVTVASRIGPEGGILEHAGHRLVVPAGAVGEPALFRLSLTASGYVEVDLTATGTGNRASVDLGHAGFAVPVVLELSYAHAEGVADPASLRVLWVKEDGTYATLTSRVDLDRRIVTARLDHFSKYALGLE